MFLKDSNNCKQKNDAFNIHTQISNTICGILKKINIEDCAFTLGLFGKWGSGKSFIINKIRETLPKTGYTILYVDVWKFIGNPLLRSILFEFCKQLKPENKNKFQQRLHHKLYSKEAIIENEQCNISDKKIDFITEIKKNIVNIVLALIVVIALPIIFFKFSEFILFYLKINDIKTIAAICSVSFPLLTFAFTTLIKPLNVFLNGIKVKNYELLPNFSPEQFEDLFSELINNHIDKGTKLIVIFDNLDRCEPHYAYETLSTIKTFMDKPNCFYIVPCDDDAIKNYIKQSYKINSEDDDFSDTLKEEFFDKLFDTYLRIPMLKESDRDNFIESQLKSLFISDEIDEIEINKIIQILYYAYKGETPRQIKRFLNDLCIYFELAKNIDKQKENLLKDIPTFVIMIAILQKWNDILPELVSNMTLIQDYYKDKEKIVEDRDSFYDFLNDVDYFFDKEIPIEQFIFLQSIDNATEIKNTIDQGKGAAIKDITAEKETLLHKIAKERIRKGFVFATKAINSILLTICGNSKMKLTKLEKLFVDSVFDDNFNFNQYIDENVDILVNILELVKKHKQIYQDKIINKLYGFVVSDANTAKLSIKSQIEAFSILINNPYIQFNDKQIFNIMVEQDISKDSFGYLLLQELGQINKIDFVPDKPIKKLLDDILNGSKYEDIETINKYWDRSSLPKACTTNVSAIVSNLSTNANRAALNHLQQKALIDCLKLLSCENIDSTTSANIKAYTLNYTSIRNFDRSNFAMNLTIESMWILEEQDVSRLIANINQFGIQNFIDNLPNFSYFEKFWQFKQCNNLIINQVASIQSFVNKFPEKISPIYKEFIPNTDIALGAFRFILGCIKEEKIKINKETFANYYCSKLSNYNAQNVNEILKLLNEFDLKPSENKIDNEGVANIIRDYYKQSPNDFEIITTVQNFISEESFCEKYLTPLMNYIKNILIDQKDKVPQYRTIVPFLIKPYINKEINLIKKMIEELLEENQEQEEYEFAIDLILKLNEFNKLKTKDFEKKLNDVKNIFSPSKLAQLTEIGFNLKLEEQ